MVFSAMPCGLHLDPSPIRRNYEQTPGVEAHFFAESEGHD